MTRRASQLLLGLAVLTFICTPFLLAGLVNIEIGQLRLSPLAFAGFVFSIGWSCLAFWAALRRYALAWVILCLMPLVIYSISWLLVLSEAGDPWGLKAGVIVGFSLSALVAAFSAVVFLTQARPDRSTIADVFGV